jgi:hypothetical protein
MYILMIADVSEELKLPNSSMSIGCVVKYSTDFLDSNVLVGFFVKRFDYD